MRERARNTFQPDYLVLPGQSVQEAIEYLGLSQKEFARRLDLTEQSLNRILKGEQPITNETAFKLESVTGTSCDFWIALETNYQRQKQILNASREEKEYKKWLKRIPIKELNAYGCLNIMENTVEQVNEVLKFYQIGSIDVLDGLVQQCQAAARGTVAFNTEAIKAVTYVQIGLRKAQTIVVEPFDRSKFKEVLLQARALSKDLPADFGVLLQEMFASAGVALVYVPPIKGVHFSGVSKWISKNKAMIIMNIRGKAEDRFWFSLFHEAAHLLLHERKTMYISDSSPANEEEQEADRYAARLLIPEKYDARIAAAKTAGDISEVANELGISAGIVVGRYHHLTNQWSHFKQLIRPLDWNKE